MDYTDYSPDQLVALFADKTQCNEAVRALIGGLTATELRRVRVSDAAKAALIRGLKHGSSKVRWSCIQLMDHIADETYVAPLLTAAYTDPRRRIAVMLSMRSPAKNANRIAAACALTFVPTCIRLCSLILIRPCVRPLASNSPSL